MSVKYILWMRQKSTWIDWRFVSNSPESVAELHGVSIGRFSSAAFGAACKTSIKQTYH